MMNFFMGLLLWDAILGVEDKMRCACRGSISG
jgi:hypothetical protein